MKFKNILEIKYLFLIYSVASFYVNAARPFNEGNNFATNSGNVGSSSRIGGSSGAFGSKPFNNENQIGTRSSYGAGNFGSSRNFGSSSTIGANSGSFGARPTTFNGPTNRKVIGTRSNYGAGNFGSSSRIGTNTRVYSSRPTNIIHSTTKLQGARSNPNTPTRQPAYNPYFKGHQETIKPKSNWNTLQSYHPMGTQFSAAPQKPINPKPRQPAHNPNYSPNHQPRNRTSNLLALPPDFKGSINIDPKTTRFKRVSTPSYNPDLNSGRQFPTSPRSPINSMTRQPAYNPNYNPNHQPQNYISNATSHLLGIPPDFRGSVNIDPNTPILNRLPRQPFYNPDSNFRMPLNNAGVRVQPKLLQLHNQSFPNSTTGLKPMSVYNKNSSDHNNGFDRELSRRANSQIYQIVHSPRGYDSSTPPPTLLSKLWNNTVSLGKSLVPKLLPTIINHFTHKKEKGSNSEKFVPVNHDYDYEEYEEHFPRAFDSSRPPPRYEYKVYNRNHQASNSPPSTIILVPHILHASDSSGPPHLPPPEKFEPLNLEHDYDEEYENKKSRKITIRHAKVLNKKLRGSMISPPSILKLKGYTESKSRLNLEKETTEFETSSKDHAKASIRMIISVISFYLLL